MNASEKAPQPAAASSAPKKHMAAKEPPAFQWKLAGYVDGLTVTLLKTEDRSEIEAQLKRLEADGYYREVRIYPIHAKIPPDPLAAKFARQKKTARSKADTNKAKKKSKKKASVTSKKTKTRSKAKKPPTKKTATKRSAAKKRPAKTAKTAPSTKAARKKTGKKR